MRLRFSLPQRSRPFSTTLITLAACAAAAAPASAAGDPPQPVDRTISYDCQISAGASSWQETLPLRVRATVPTALAVGEWGSISGGKLSIATALPSQLPAPVDPASVFGGTFDALTIDLANASKATRTLGGAGVEFGAAPLPQDAAPLELRAPENGTAPSAGGLTPAATANPGDSIEIRAGHADFTVRQTTAASSASFAYSCDPAAGANVLLAKVAIPRRGGSHVGAPVVSRLAPGYGVARFGGLVAVSGDNLDRTIGVKVGGRHAEFLKVSKTQMFVSLPPLREGTYDLIVRTPQGSSATSDASKVVYFEIPRPEIRPRR